MKITSFFCFKGRVRFLCPKMRFRFFAIFFFFTNRFLWNFREPPLLGEILLFYLKHFSLYTIVSSEKIFILKCNTWKNKFRIMLKISNFFFLPYYIQKFAKKNYSSYQHAVFSIIKKKVQIFFPENFIAIGPVVPIFFWDWIWKSCKVRFFFFGSSTIIANLKSFRPKLFAWKIFEKQVFLPCFLLFSNIFHAKSIAPKDFKLALIVDESKRKNLTIQILHI